MTIPMPLLQVWDETGSTPLGVLAGVTSVAMSDTLSDVGAATVTFPRNAPGASLLAGDADRQLRAIIPGAPDMWWLWDDDSSTWVSDDPSREVVSGTCRSLSGVFGEAVVIPSGGVGATPAEWAFTTATPGKVVADLVASAQSRSLLQGVTLTGSATVDAAGDAWPDTLTATYKAGTTLLTIMQNLAKAQVLEWRMNGRALEIYAPAGGLDRQLTSVLRPGRDVIAAPVQRSRKGVVTAVLVEGESGSTARRTQVLAGRREREVYVSQSSAPSGSLAAVGDLQLGAHSAALVQMTHEVTDGDTTPCPWVDYRPGDRIRTTASGAVAAHRIMQVAVTWDGSGAKSTLELGSLAEEAQLVMARQLATLLPGSQSLA